MTAATAATRMGGSTGRPPSARMSSVIVVILRIFMR